MIAAIRGILIRKSNNLIIETSSGLTYEINTPKPVLLSDIEVGTPIHVYTSLIVREQELSLVGFLSYEEKLLFELLVTAKGIGPKQALKILDETNSHDLCTGIAEGNIKHLSKVKGISTKKAEQLIFDLQDKIKKFLTEYIDTQETVPRLIDNKKIEISLALRALGYADHEVKKTLDTFLENRNLEQEKTETLVSDFLLVLSKL